jgi:hypothetical protein
MKIFLILEHTDMDFGTTQVYPLSSYYTEERAKQEIELLIATKRTPMTIEEFTQAVNNDIIHNTDLYVYKTYEEYKEDFLHDEMSMPTTYVIEEIDLVE